MRYKPLVQKCDVSLPVVLKEEFAKRRTRNPYYSQRAFAKFLDLPSGRLSELMQGKRKPTSAVIKKIINSLQIKPQLQTELLEQASRSKRAQKVRVHLTVQPKRVDEAFALVAEEQFQILADWQHFAILSLMDLKGFRSDHLWIARRLGIHPSVAFEAIEKLKRGGLIREFKGRWIKTQHQFKTTDQVASAALRESHSQTLQQTMACLDSVPIEDRDFSSMSLALHPKRIPLAKTLIRNFRRQFAELVEKGEKTEVYNLNIQFVPVTKKAAE